MKLKYKWHSYSNEHEYEIEVPDDIVFVYVEGSVGRMRHHGYNHYLGAIKGEWENKDNWGIRTYKDFPGITLIEFNNVIFQSEVKVISPEEFYDKFDFSSYYVFKYTERKFKGKTGNFLEDLMYGNVEEIPSRLISITKILKIRSQHLIDTITCFVSSWLDSDDSEVKQIMLNTSMDLDRIVEEFHCETVVKKDCDKEFTDAINQVLGLVNKKCL